VKTGLRYAVVTFIAGFILMMLLYVAAPALFPSLVALGSERVGEILGRALWFFSFVAFVVGWIRQANRKEKVPPTAPPPAAPTPENLQPIEYSKLSQLYDDDDRKA